MRLIAIDPGAVSGAYALFNDRVPWSVTDIPVVDGQIDAAEFARVVSRFNPEAAIVEKVASMPKQGVSSTFKFGVGVGIIHGVLMASNVPMHLVAPTLWKKHFGLIGSDKEAGRAAAIRLFPGVVGLARKRDHGRADALLMGKWFLERKL